MVTAAIDPAGAVIVTGSNDGQGRTWDAQTGRVQTVLPGHLNFVDNVDVTADGAFVVTGSPDRTARTWTTGGRLEAVLAGHTDAVTASLFTPRGAMVVTASDDGTIRLWDSGTSPDLVEARVRPPSAPTLEAISEAGSSTARAKGSDIELTRDGTTTTLAGHTDVVTSVAFSRDGDRLVSASRDNDAILWDVPTGRALPRPPCALWSVFDARFSPDGRWIVTAGPISVGLWNASNGVFVKYLRGAPGPLAVAGFREDSRTVVARSRDGTVTRFRCAYCGTTSELLELARSRLAATDRTLTDEERELYVG